MLNRVQPMVQVQRESLQDRTQMCGNHSAFIRPQLSTCPVQQSQIIIHLQRQEALIRSTVRRRGAIIRFALLVDGSQQAIRVRRLAGPL